MSRSKLRYDVFLTQDAIQILTGDSIFSSLLQDNKYLHCISVEPTGYFVDLVVEFDSVDLFSSSLSKKKETFELSIPAHFVLYIVSAHRPKTLGFQNKEQGANKDNAGNP